MRLCPLFPHALALIELLVKMRVLSEFRDYFDEYSYDEMQSIAGAMRDAYLNGLDV